MRRWAMTLGVVAGLGAGAAPGNAAEVASDAVEVTFRVNDAFVKDRMLPGVAITLTREAGDEPVAAGTTDALGVATLELVPGRYLARYELPGYVTIPASETAIEGAGQVVTTTLTMLLESEGSPPDARRVRVTLNWGANQSNQVRDLDSHLACACAVAQPHVAYTSMIHTGADHHVALDVDDTDWGGPETVTLSNPPPGTHRYWVHDFSNGPGTIGGSDVVVRVFVGDHLAGEYRPPPSASGSVWRPFAAIRVDPSLTAEVVPFSAEELAAGLADAMPEYVENAPVDDGIDGTSADAPRERPPWWASRGRLFAAALLIAFVVHVIRHARRRRQR